MVKKVFLTVLLLLSAILFAYFFISSVTLAFYYHEYRKALPYAGLGCVFLILYAGIWYMPKTKMDS